MGTRSRIGYRDPETDKIVSVYCHWDGYPSYNGKILLDNYNTLDKVKDLVSGGDMSSLGPRCDLPEGHSFEKPVDGYTVYYGRDHGEKNVGPIVSKSMEEFDDIHSDQEWEYMFIDRWLYRKFGDSKWYTLTPELCTD